jgi:hypothetical protein
MRPPIPKTNHPKPDPKTFQQQHLNLKAAVAAGEQVKRANVFSKSRDVREDRGSRQMKTTRNAQSFPHVR